MPRSKGDSEEAPEQTDAYRFGEILEYVLNEEPPEEQYPADDVPQLTRPEGSPPHEPGAAPSSAKRDHSADNGTIVVQAQSIDERIGLEFPPHQAVQPARELLLRIAGIAADAPERLRVGLPLLRVATIPAEAFHWAPVAPDQRKPGPTVMQMACLENLYRAHEWRESRFVAMTRPRAPFVSPRQYAERTQAFGQEAAQWKGLRWEAKVVLAAEELHEVLTRDGYGLAQCPAKKKTGGRWSPCGNFLVQTPGHNPRIWCSPNCRKNESRRRRAG